MELCDFLGIDLMEFIFWFRNDLRIADNTALLTASSKGSLLPLFVRDPRIYGRNPFSTAFLEECLRDLNAQLQAEGGRLHVVEGIPEKIVPQLVKRLGLEGVAFNADSTPFALKRDWRLMESFTDIKVIVGKDRFLLDFDMVKSGSGTPYKVFTPFYKRASREFARFPQSGGHFEFIATDELVTLSEGNSGRDTGIALLKRAASLKDYGVSRDFPSIAGTSNLSPHIKFGTLSIREVYHTLANSLGEHHPLIRQLFWREFFYYISYHFPHVMEGTFIQKYRALPFENDPLLFEAWTVGKTGFPLVDAGMRQLNATGELHNRVRMVVASFLVKDLLIDWRWGERYFSRKLVDYDPVVNRNSWQWVASVGVDAVPYFRIFNPWRQQKRFDPDAEYIRKWVPELGHLSAKEIHRIEKVPVEGYPPPIVNHRERASLSKDMFQNLV